MERWGREADRRLEAFERGEMSAVDGPAVPCGPKTGEHLMAAISLERMRADAHIAQVRRWAVNLFHHEK